VLTTGTATPTGLVDDKVTLIVQREQSGKWLKLVSMARTIKASCTYGGTYRPAKTGTYRMKATIARTTAHTASTTTWSTFKVR
jgi:hypothetical protein